MRDLILRIMGAVVGFILFGGTMSLIEYQVLIGTNPSSAILPIVGMGAVGAIGGAFIMPAIFQRRTGL